jgi:hypothetical protein
MRASEVTSDRRLGLHRDEPLANKHSDARRDQPLRARVLEVTGAHGRQAREPLETGEAPQCERSTGLGMGPPYRVTRIPRKATWDSAKESIAEYPFGEQRRDSGAGGAVAVDDVQSTR